MYAFNEWVLKGWGAGRAGSVASARSPTLGNMTSGHPGVEGGTADLRQARAPRQLHALTGDDQEHQESKATRHPTDERATHREMEAGLGGDA